MWKWEAIYSLDGKESLKQFDGETENLFGDIKQDKIIAFRIDKEDGRHIIVDLKKGIFMINGSIFEVPGQSFKNVNYRLIYFRRVARNIGTSGTDVSSDTEHFVGFQFTENDTNKKVMLSTKKDLYSFHIK